MNDDLVPVSGRIVSRQFVQTHEALNICVVLVKHAREICQESTINASKILRSELRLYIKVSVMDVNRQESWRFCSEQAAKHQGNDGWVKF